MRVLCNSATMDGFSGYAAVCKNLIPLLNDTSDHDFVFFTRSGRYSSRPTMYQGVPVYSPPNVQGTPEQYIPQLMNHLNMDICLHVMDAWILDNVIDQLKFLQMSYAPIDTSPLSPRWLKVLSNIYTVIPYCEFGKRQIKDAGLKNYREPIGHGVSDEFKPRNKQVLDWDIEDPFTVGIFKANIGTRANYDHTLEAIKWFLDENPDAREDFRLYLHTSKGGQNSYNLEFLLKMFGLEDVARFPNQTQYNFGELSPRHLSEIYSNLDVLLNSTRAEGWGLPVLESLSCGTPALITHGSAMKDIYEEGKGIKWIDVWKNKSTFGEDDAFEIRPRKMSSYAFPKRESIKDQLEWAYYNRDKLPKLGRKGRRWTRQHTWVKKAVEWIDTLDEIEDEISGGVKGDLNIDEFEDLTDVGNVPKTTDKGQML